MANSEIIVVGAGALGAATAFHLVALGAQVTVVDPHVVGSQTTARAAGQCMHVHSSDALSRIGIRSIEMFHRFPQEVERSLDFMVSGSIKIARTDDSKRQLHDEVARGKRLGVDIEFSEPAEAMSLAPWFEPPDGCEIWFTSGDCYFEFPDSVPRAYLSAAVERGARFVASRVLDITDDRGVLTADGVIGGDVVVVAAGAWTRRLLADAGVPVWPVRHQVLITQPLDTVKRAQPSVRFIEAKTYTRPHLGGLMFGGYERVPWSPEDPGSIDAVDAVPRSEDVLRDMIARIGDAIPALVDARRVEVRAGLPTMSPDGHFVVDRLDPSNTWVISGCNVTGFSTSPALGADLAQWILGGRRPADLAGFGLDRFTSSYLDDAVMRAAAQGTYSDRYSYEELAEH